MKPPTAPLFSVSSLAAVVVGEAHFVSPGKRLISTVGRLLHNQCSWGV